MQIDISMNVLRALQVLCKELRLSMEPCHDCCVCCRHKTPIIYFHIFRTLFYRTILSTQPYLLTEKTLWSNPRYFLICFLIQKSDKIRCYVLLGAVLLRCWNAVWTKFRPQLSSPPHWNKDVNVRRRYMSLSTFITSPIFRAGLFYPGEKTQSDTETRAGEAAALLHSLRFSWCV